MMRRPIVAEPTFRHLCTHLTHPARSGLILDQVFARLGYLASLGALVGGGIAREWARAPAFAAASGFLGMAALVFLGLRP